MGVYNTIIVVQSSPTPFLLPLPRFFDVIDFLNPKATMSLHFSPLIFQIFMQLLYEAPDMEESIRSTTDMYNDALAIYCVTYDYAKAIGDVRKCGFAWKVAGAALCKLHAELHAKEHNQKVMAMSPSILHKLLNLRINQKVS
uniref:RNA-dependent RNA polymerase family protein n=1 Tax=Solanum tuberosum TaxID=4113 RepID=M0ZHN4_SOLTU